ncbi:unnamed protein product [Rotaria sordida]|uniref:Amyloid-beta-like protein n=1 Tax=Rotaria sordida TaxID=392033 RepID=A0A818WMU8_9BILA|nr:unnamed protein product [Rotaria sordida]CAF3728401.1 unnamed protein product [Rotaria sordida]
MKSLLNLVSIALLIYSTHSVILKTPMVNNYPQIAVLGCDSNKANLYYDIKRQVWIENLVSSCVNNEQSILEFCQKAYPSLPIGNIVRLDKVLRFKNWCEILPSKNNKDIPGCKTESQTEELVQPFRCLYMNSKREELSLPTSDCIMNSITGTGQCLRAEKWQQLASLNCSNKTMVLNNSIMTSDWCGLAKFRGIEFICCPLKDVETNNVYPTNLDKQNDDDDNTLNEDDPIEEPVVSVPPPPPTTTSTVETHRKIIAMSLGSREPNWIKDNRQWETISEYFADDEDLADDQEEIKLSSARKSHLTINEHERFTKDKNEFRRKFKEQIDQLKLRWQNRQNDIQLLVNMNPYQAQQEYIQNEIEFSRGYDFILQTANRERTRINELHEKNLDAVLDNAKNETNQKLIAVWNEKPLNVENIQDALYNYLHVLLRDRIHLVNRYERLRVVDPNQAKRKRVSIHQRLRSIANQINDALNQLQRHSKFQSKIQPHIDSLLGEYDEVNKAAEKLLNDYMISSSTVMTNKNRILPLGRDEKRIYPFSSISTNKIDDKNSNDDYYGTNDDYDDDDGDDDDDDENNNESTTTTIETNNSNDQIDIGDSDWDLDDRIDPTFNIKIETNENEQIYDDMRPLMPNNDIILRRTQRNLFITYLPYISVCLLILCIIFTLLMIRCIIQQRRKYQYGNPYEKKYAFKEVDLCTPEEKALYALQMNGYENPTYKFFESQTPKC